MANDALDHLLSSLARRAAILVAQKGGFRHGVFVFGTGFSLRSGVTFDPPSSTGAARRLCEILERQIRERGVQGYVFVAPALDCGPLTGRGAERDARLLCVHLRSYEQALRVRAAYPVDHLPPSTCRLTPQLRLDAIAADEPHGDMVSLVTFSAVAWLHQLGKDCAAVRLCAGTFAA